MAIVQNPFTGRTSGKFAGAVFSKQFGKNTLRSKPVSVKNPKTEKQKAQRDRFTMLIVIARMLLTFVRISFKQATVGMSAFNTFVQKNIVNFVAGLWPNLTYDWSKLIVSMGTLMGFYNLAGSAVALHKVNVTWDDNTGDSGAEATDKVFVVLINTTTTQLYPISSNVTRVDGSVDIDLPAAWIGDSVAIYSTLSDADEIQFSDSEYIATIVVLA